MALYALEVDADLGFGAIKKPRRPPSPPSAVHPEQCGRWIVGKMKHRSLAHHHVRLPDSARAPGVGRKLISHFEIKSTPLALFLVAGNALPAVAPDVGLIQKRE